MYSVNIVSHTLARSHWEPPLANEKQAFQGKEAEQVGLTTGTTEEGASLTQTGLLLRAESAFEKKEPNVK